MLPSEAITNIAVIVVNVVVVMCVETQVILPPPPLHVAVTQRGRRQWGQELQWT